MWPAETAIEPEPRVIGPYFLDPNSNPNADTLVLADKGHLEILS